MVRNHCSPYSRGAELMGKLPEFDKLGRLVERQVNLSERVPSFYVRTLLSLDQALNTALAKEKEAKKKMNAPNARALNTMKQKVRKTAKEHEKEIKLLQEVKVSQLKC